MLGTYYIRIRVKNANTHTHIYIYIYIYIYISIFQVDCKCKLTQGQFCAYRIILSFHKCALWLKNPQSRSNQKLLGQNRSKNTLFSINELFWWSLSAATSSNPYGRKWRQVIFTQEWGKRTSTNTNCRYLFWNYKAAIHVTVNRSKFKTPPSTYLISTTVAR